MLAAPQAVRFIPAPVMERAEYAADHFPIRLQDNWRAALVVLLVGADAHFERLRLYSLIDRLSPHQTPMNYFQAYHLITRSADAKMAAAAAAYILFRSCRLLAT